MGAAAAHFNGQVIDYTKCPYCNSTDISEITGQETEDSKTLMNSKQVDHAIENIKKYKELFDAGVITQEEFDAKKKQLLDL